MSNTIQFIRLGMLGGGQLGRMLLQKAADFDLRIAVLDPDPEAPCRYLCEEFVCGNFRDYQTVYDFGKKCDLMTIEIEHVNTEALFQLQKEGVKIHPSPEIIQLVQDKGLQKEFYKKHSIPTADFVLIENKSEISKHSSGFPWMQKLRKGGYDGKGVQPLKSATDLTAAFDAPSILEKMIPFTKEIAVIVSRNDKGDVACFPSVEMEFNPEANLVEFLSSPAHISKAVEEKAQNLYARSLQLVGDKDPRQHEFTVQLRAFDAARTGAKLGVASLVALCTSLLKRSVRGGLIIVGEINLGGSIEPVHNAVTIAEIAVEKGATSLLMPVACRRQLVDLSDDMATKIDIQFYSDARDALLKAMAE